MQAINRWLGCALLVVASTTAAYAIPITPGVMDSDSTHPSLPAFEPGEMWNIDSKVDDGMPGTGEFVIYGTDGGAAIPNCTDSTDNSVASAASAKYLVSANTKECAAVFRNQF